MLKYEGTNKLMEELRSICGDHTQMCNLSEFLQQIGAKKMEYCPSQKPLIYISFFTCLRKPYSTYAIKEEPCVYPRKSTGRR